MSGPGEAFTLLESGTSRMHFKLAKALEDATSPHASDLAIRDTLTQIRTRLASKTSSRHLSELVPPLLTLLHCLHHYPSAGQQQEPLDVGFALLPTLQLLSLATEWNDVLLAHQLLPFLFERRPSPLPISSSSSAQSRPAHSDEDHSSSLLLLNTFRANLTATLASRANDVTSLGSPSSGSASRSRSRSRSPLRTRPLSTPGKTASASRIDIRTMETLKSLANGIPKGPAVLPSLASTLVALTRHPDSAIRSLTLDAMLSCTSLPAEANEAEADRDLDGQREMLDAALTIARLVLASTYAFSAGSDIDEQDGVILAEMERRVDPNPAVLRSCLRIVERARLAGLISSNELACHIVEILQATRWLPMHLELKSLQQIDVQAQVINRTEGLRARAAARQRGPLQAQHSYYGTYAPWLTEACLAALSRCASDLLASSKPNLEPSTHAELLRSVLRIYNSASQGKAAALALCVAAARCIGALYATSQDGSEASASLFLPASGGKQDGETAALWSALTQHTRSQLGSTNPNRKAAGIMLLDALLPVGWANQNIAASTGEAGEGATSLSPLHITEEDMAQLMALLADSDSSIRRRALRLLHRVDAGLTSLMRTQLQSAVDTELLNGNETLIDRNAVSTKGLMSVALRLLEVVSFSVQSADSDAKAAAESELEKAVISIMPLNPFGSFDSIESLTDTTSSSAFLWQLQTFPIDTRLALMRRLLEVARPAPAPSGALHLLCTLLADITPSDLRAKSDALDSFRNWSVTELLGSDGIISLLMRVSGEARALAASREATLAITARTVSLMLHLEDREEASAALAACLEALQPLLSKLIETESIAAIRLEASNLQLICRTILHPAGAQHTGLIHRIKTMGSACQGMADSAKWLLTFEVDHTSAIQRKEDRTEGSTGSSLLIAASRFFGPSSTRDHRTAHSWTQSASSADSFAAVRLREQLPDSLLQSSVLLSPDDSTATLRSSDRHSSRGNSKPSTHTRQALSQSAIPSETKRTRDRRIAEAMSESIANLVLGSDAHPSSSENEVIFSATSSGVLEGEELELVEEVADPERRLDLATDAGKEPSLLDLVHQCHNHDPWLDTSLTPFILDGVQIGFLPARVVKACMDDSDRQRRAGLPAVLRKVRFAMNHREIVPPSAKSRVCEAVTFTAEFATEEARTRGLNEVAQRWRKERIFPDPLDGWRDELYAIYGLNPHPGTRNPIAFKLERAACALFGLATFGVHLTAYTVAPETGELRVWVPQRSSTKSTWPGYLDNSVAGGIVAGDLPMESVVRECEEEANLEATLVEKHIKQTGVLSYCYKTSAQGWIQPEVEYVYDLPLPADVVLQPKDGEVDHFELLTLDQIYEKMRQGRFKANCVLVILDFLIRHGYITADKEPAYRQIVAQLHVDLRLPGP